MIELITFVVADDDLFNDDGPTDKAYSTSNMSMKRFVCHSWSTGGIAKQWHASLEVRGSFYDVFSYVCVTMVTKMSLW